MHLKGQIAIDFELPVGIAEPSEFENRLDIALRGHTMPREWYDQMNRCITDVRVLYVQVVDENPEHVELP